EVQNASEGGADGYVRLTRTGLTGAALSVDFELDLSSSAEEGMDFSTLARTATFAIGQSLVDVPIHAIDDNDVDADESVSIYLMDMSGVFLAGTPGSGTVTITDNDVAAVVTVSAVQDGTEGGSNGFFELTRTGTANSPLSVSYYLNSTADAGNDFSYLLGTSSGSPDWGTVTFRTGENTLLIPVSIVDDNSVEGDETIELYLMDEMGDGSFVIGTPSSDQVTIHDNDVAAVVAVSSVQDAYEGGSDGFFRLSRTVADAALTVSFVVDEYYTTASNGVDVAYLAGTDATDAYYGEITFAAGAFDVDIVVASINDDLTEGDETIQITLIDDMAYGAYTGYETAAYTLGATYSGIVTVYDDEDINAPPVVRIDSTRDASENGQRGYFRLRRGGLLDDELTVTYQIDAASTVVNGQDVAFLTGTAAGSGSLGAVTFGAGNAYADIAVNAIDDDANEGNESLRISLVDDVAYDLAAPSSASVTVRDNDEPLTVTIGKLANEVQTIVLPEASGGNWTISDGVQTTSPISIHANALTVQNAIENLSAVGAGNVSVTGEGRLGSPFKVTFIGTLSSTDTPALVVDASGLTGVAAAAASVSTEVEGLDGQNEVFEITIESSNGNAVLDAADGYIAFLWGEPGPGSFPGNQAARTSDAVSWTATVSAIKAAIEGIENVANAGGDVDVVEVASTATRRTLRVEFQGALRSQDVSELTAVSDGQSTPVQDVEGNPAIVRAETAVEGARGIRSEVQVVSVSHAQSGDFTLTYLTEVTAPIALNASAKSVETALLGLSNIGDGDVKVTGQDGGPWRIAFQGALAGRNLQQLTVATSGLVGGQVITNTVTDGGQIIDATQDAIEGGASGYFRIHRTGSTADELTVVYTVEASRWPRISTSTAILCMPLDRPTRQRSRSKTMTRH
ncbi:MAG: hypothetical protein HYV60_01830, partial [Planctomycetia bacterium]|nr:hypothetical protein [Planctomycetia bacterium]